MNSLRNVGFTALLAVLASVAISAPAASLEVKAKWECKTNAATITCIWEGCGVATSEPGKVSLWATGSGELKGIFYFLRLSNGNPAGEQWTNTNGSDKEVPEAAKIDIFQRECVQNTAAGDLPPQVQEQFHGKYGIPERPPVLVPLRETGLDDLEIQASK